MVYNKAKRGVESMNRTVTEYFKSVGVDYFAALSYADCREINTPLRERMGFEPRTAIIFLLPYYAGETVNLSRYAASLDYHLAIREITDGLITALKAEYPEGSFAGYGDHSPIDEVGAALAAGLGVIGDNGLIINEEYGSYVFVADLLTDLSPELFCARKPMPTKHCERCGACKRACPTGILSGEGADCLSAITQRKGELAEWEISLMRKEQTVWGCDVCQSVCPHNKSPKMTPIAFFHRERIPKLTLEILEGMPRVEFSRRAFAWRGRKTVERNLRLLYPDSK